MTRVPVSIPQTIWSQLPGGVLTVDLRLRDGRTMKAMVVDDRGVVEGKWVGGRDGVSDEVLDFHSEDIVAARVAQGLLGTLGLTSWKT